jgi:hypothetical protein
MDFADKQHVPEEVNFSLVKSRGTGQQCTRIS